MRRLSSMEQTRLSEMREELRQTHRIYKILLIICLIIIGCQRLHIMKIEQPEQLESTQMEEIQDMPVDTSEVTLPDLPKISLVPVDAKDLK